MSGIVQPPIVIPANHGGTQLPIVLRPMESSDRGYVVGTWVDSYTGRRCTGPADTRGQRKLAHALLDRCSTTIAAFDEDLSTIIGWACTSSDAVHYVYVRGGSKEDRNNDASSFRRMGIAKLLLKPYLERTGILYTHAPSRNWQRRDAYTLHTTRGDHSIPAVPPGWVFDPHHAYEIAATVPRYREIISASEYTRKEPPNMTDGRNSRR